MSRIVTVPLRFTLPQLRRCLATSVASDAPAAGPAFTGRIPVEELRIIEGGARESAAARVEIRFRLADATFVPAHLKPLLARLQAARISREGEFVVASERTRKRLLNRADCMETIRECVRQAEAAAEAQQLPKATQADAAAAAKAPADLLATGRDQALARPFDGGQLSFRLLRDSRAANTGAAA